MLMLIILISAKRPPIFAMAAIRVCGVETYFMPVAL